MANYEVLGGCLGQARVVMREIQISSDKNVFRYPTAPNEGIQFTIIMLEYLTWGRCLDLGNGYHVAATQWTLGRSDR